MLSKCLLPVAGLIILSSCTSVRKELPATALGYEMRSYKVSSTPECADGADCAIYEINYPVFSGVDTVVSQSIQRAIELTFSMGDPEADEKTLRQVADEFLSNYREFTGETSDGSQGWYYHGEARVNVLLDTLISISLDEEYYTGGAHGGNGKYFINVDPRTGEEYKLNDFFGHGFEEPLTRLAEAAFRQERDLHDTATYAYNYFEFPDNRFTLNGNFGFTPYSIVFYFNNYEIAPYAAGPTEVLIELEKIKSLFKR